MMKYFQLLLPFLLLQINLFAQKDTSLTFTEVMFKTTSGENSEFVEIYNLSDRDTINLNGYNIKYYTSSFDRIVNIPGGDSLLLPKQYAVIFEGDYDFQNGVYAGEIGRDALVMQIDNGAFGSNGMSNSSDRNIMLLNPENDTLEVYTYSSDNSTNYSDEKIILNKNNLKSNWQNSNLMFGTPGYENSVSPKKFDLSIQSFTIFPRQPLEADTLMIRILIKNIGTKNANNFSVRIFNNLEIDSSINADEMILDRIVSILHPNDSLLFTAHIDSIEIKSYLLIAELNFPDDQSLENNIKYLNFTGKTRSANRNDVVINEFMYKPLKGEPEWIEIYNRSRKTLDLSGWQIRDKSSGTLIPGSEIILKPREYLVLTKNDLIGRIYDIPSGMIELSLPSLNNSGDQIRIIDNRSRTIDSLEFTSKWGGYSGGKSLERISPETNSVDSTNWSDSKALARATPGKINSVTQKKFDLQIYNLESVPKYITAGDTVLFEVTIINSGKLDNNYKLKLYEDTDFDGLGNTLIDESSNLFLPAGDSIKYTFNFKIKGINRSYALFAEILPQSDQDNLNNFFYKIFSPRFRYNDVVINELMNTPPENEPEWIELFNRGNYPVNIWRWSLSDRTKTIIIENNFTLTQGEYLVISQSSSLTDFYEINSPLFEVDLPSLNNSDDDIVLRDATGEVIDSLAYHSFWGTGAGISLERIAPDSATNNYKNWGGSISYAHATPGKINSLSKKEFDIAITGFRFSPPKPIIGDTTTISVIVCNTGKRVNSFSLRLWKDADNDGVEDSLLSYSDLFNISPGDTVFYTFNYNILITANTLYFIVNSSASKDDNLSDNNLSIELRPALPRKSIVINEILFNSSLGEPEWFELYNRSDFPADLNGWSISDVLTNPVRINIDTSIIILPHNYLVIAKSNLISEFHKFIPSNISIIQFPNLNNDRDGVVLRDFYNRSIDSVFYDDRFTFSDNASIERIKSEASSVSPLNWLPSIDKEYGTPGRINSVTPKDFDLVARSISTVPNYPISGDNVFPILSVKNTGEKKADYFFVLFYYKNHDNLILLDNIDKLSLAPGETITVNSNNYFSLDSLTTIFARIIFQPDEDTLNNFLEKNVTPGYAGNSLQISEFMPNPGAGESEWIELKNGSNRAVNLRNWKIGDVVPSNTKSSITYDDVLLPPGAFLVIAPDSAVYINRDLSDAVFIKSDFGSLGNSRDGIAIYDFRNALIDSIFYDSGWNIKKSRSLERFSFEMSTNDSTNWHASVDLSGSTPGKENSVSDLAHYNFNNIIINEIMFDPGTNKSEFIELYNTSSAEVDIAGWFLIESGGASEIATAHYFVPQNEFFLIANDSSFFNDYPMLINSSNVKVLEGKFSLSNSGESLLIKNIYNETIDSVYYSSDWNNPNVLETTGKSLERLSPMIDSNDPTNWSTSVNSTGATPGANNSVYVEDISSKSQIYISPNPFSPDNDGFEDFTVIKYSLKNPISQIRLRIFDSQGRPVRTLINNMVTGAKGSIIFDGLSDNGKPLKIGIYILLIETLDSSSGTFETFKKALVIARKL